MPARRHLECATDRIRPLSGKPPEAYYACRTLQALELLTFNDLSCPQVAAALQIHPRTARRLLGRLAADGYIEQTFDSRRRYRATLRLAALGCQVVAHAELPRIAASHVAELHAATGAVAHLVIPSYRGVACVVHGDGSCAGAAAAADVARAAARARHCRGQGAAGVQAAVAGQRSGQSLASLHRGHYDLGTGPRARDHPDPPRGYAIDDGEYRPGTLGVAAPVLVRGQVPAALAVSGPQPAGAGDVVDALVERVVVAAARLTLALREAEPGSDGPCA